MPTPDPRTAESSADGTVGRASRGRVVALYAVAVVLALVIVAILQWAR